MNIDAFPQSALYVAVLVVLVVAVILFLFLLRAHLNRKKQLLRPVKKQVQADEKPLTYVNRIKEGLTKTRQHVTETTRALFSRNKFDSAALEELEEALILADLGPEAALSLSEAIRKRARAENNNPEMNLKTLLKEELINLLRDNGAGQFGDSIDKKPYVVLVVGVNGSGKTTSIGKIAKLFTDKGLKVVLAAADTFRAAAIEQLEIWSQRASCQLVKHRAGADPAAVVFDAMEAAKARHADVIIVDTAGRLHTKTNLMEELKKIKRVIQRELPDAPHETLLVVDSTSGQNVIQQAKSFKEAVSVTGIALTKLDGTAKGGVVVAVRATVGLPVKLIGVGEGVDDLKPFNPEEFVESLF
jgi:fused signal recognition particle receptor